VHRSARTSNLGLPELATKHGRLGQFTSSGRESQESSELEPGVSVTKPMKQQLFVFSLGMKTDRIRTDTTDIIFVFIFMFGFGFEYE
jgi:hypothetical protein